MTIIKLSKDVAQVDVSLDGWSSKCNLESHCVNASPQFDTSINFNICFRAKCLLSDGREYKVTSLDNCTGDDQYRDEHRST